MVKLALSAVALSPLLAVGRVVAVPVEDVIGRDLSTDAIDKSTDVQGTDISLSLSTLDASAGANTPLVANSSLDIRDAAFKNTCYHPSTDVSVGTIGGAVACSKFLKGLDTRQCHAKRGGLVLCEEQGTVITAYAKDTSVSSWCKHVAAGIDWMVEHCATCKGDDCKIAGML
ncbi:hypothetical protein CPC735_059500 [Coccidioides posadasii C735 delta SOWgp]|uniref:Uncharacterized protein n=1 Tax=Coccidioides posadasii (strain C735) TaxID=222929 RepID=C5PER0_COCP7|nr:hypothetical protein CPC735_059500 [Coccidioides posadasii C735 delta SOWgp]EER24580.1 hypothetical protein CPC735_059500 [Coccidioides posadasii C735 delta SOWgp]|eukprot:XP_003066725.1 hypothetical protein CPC735_059500 [Coccidioides posadasii C735 delta SOWgp]